MKNTITAFMALVLLIVTSSIAAQNEKKYDDALIWKISGNGLTQPSYLLGTHHLVHVSFVDSIPGLRDVMETTQQVVGEVLMSDQPAMQARVQQGAMMPAGESYQKLLSPEDYVKLDEGLKKLFMVGLDQLGQLKPGMLSMMYSITLYSKMYPEFNPMSHEAIDGYIQRIATENGKTIVGLETVEDQVYALFDAEPLKDQAESLVCSVENVEFSKEMVGRLNAYYKAKQLNNMYNLTFKNPNDPCKVSTAQENALFKDRNEKWMQKLPEIMKQKSSLIAVGSLHLVGENGLLDLLIAKGYTVEPVK